MAFTETTRIGWGSRLMESIKGVIAGLILFLLSFLVLFWNEGRAVKTHKGLQEGAKGTVTVMADKVDPSNDGNLVHLSGEATTTETLSDPDFGISVNAIRLSRDVEMYQWKQTEKTKSKKKVGGSKTKTTTYEYEKTWSSSLIPSDNFKEKTGHQNPSAMRYESESFQANDVTLGAFSLSPSLINKMTNWEDLRVEQTTMSEAKVVEGGTLYIGKGTTTSPQIGDLRISFSAVNPAVVSIVAQQVGSTFEPYNTSYDTQIEMLSQGTVSKDNMFEAAEAANNTMTWILRVVGFVMMFAGLALFFRPIAVVGDVIPFIGNVLGLGIGVFAGVFAFGLSFITIAVAWIFYRPLLGIGLLVVAVGVIGLFVYLGNKKKKEKQAAEGTAEA